MKPATIEWVEKAEGDLLHAKLAMPKRRSQPSLRDGICYHCQQCAEKYLKARLVEASVSFPKTHDLKNLLQLVLPHEPLWAALGPAAKSLTDCAVDFRYPGQNATEADATEAVRHCKAIRKAARHSFGLK